MFTPLPRRLVQANATRGTPPRRNRTRARRRQRPRCPTPCSRQRTSAPRWTGPSAASAVSAASTASTISTSPSAASSPDAASAFVAAAASSSARARARWRSNDAREGMRTQTGGSSPNAPSPMRSRTRSTQPTASSGMDESSAVFTATRGVVAELQLDPRVLERGLALPTAHLGGGHDGGGHLVEHVAQPGGHHPRPQLFSVRVALVPVRPCSRMRKRMTFRAAPRPAHASPPS